MNGHVIIVAGGQRVAYGEIFPAVFACGRQACDDAYHRGFYTVRSSTIYISSSRVASRFTGKIFVKRIILLAS